MAARDAMGVGRVAALVALIGAIVVGWAFGTWLGAAAAPPSPAAIAVASPPPPVQPTPAPTAPTATLEPTPASTASATPSAAGATPATDPPPPTTILAIEGTGDEVSDRFEVREGWQVVWQTDGDAFAFAIRGEPDVGTVLDLTGPSSGVTSIVSTGRFYLEITADGPWSIEIVQNT